MQEILRNEKVKNKNKTKQNSKREMFLSPFTPWLLFLTGNTNRCSKPVSETLTSEGGTNYEDSK